MNASFRLFSNIFLLYFTTSVGVKCQRNTVVPKKLSNSVKISSLTSSYNDFLDLLNPIAIERVSGSSGNVQVRNYLVSKMKNFGWNVELDSFNANTPYGVKSMSNVIATYPIGKSFYANSNANSKVLNRVVFACHYDSKYFANFKFIAATDSAVPCAMLLDMAKFLSENSNIKDFNKLIRHIQFVFFDGEEAFKEWTSTDSIYGSRNYANKLSNKYGQKSFDSIDLFVLLDLIGGDNTKFPNYFPNVPTSNNAYKILNKIEKALLGAKLLSRQSQFYFTDLQGNGQFYGVEDDHKPFLRKNVPILHLIPSPFPSVWHNQRDTVDNLFPNNIQDLRMIMKYFLMEILNNKEMKPVKAEDEF
ncbi:unnamed protein product [Brachionus calyciflorus]|uniref:glutaminyl-peptide cyclotransferase n=1 Tax=Brachionus calyciflorus TaxID=104777 RepID=A0A813VLH3_9BILA|nr:unnamed protein product [Brachionus calyciflorus]